MAALLQRSRVHGALELSVNRPGIGNLLNLELIDALHDAFDMISRNGTKVVILSSYGDDFCLGLDVEDDDDEPSLLYKFMRYETLLYKIVSAPALTVSYMRGRAVGAGADLFLACEWRFGFAGATLEFSHARFAVPEQSTCTSSLAREIAAIGRPIGIEEACDIGVITACADDLPDEDHIADMVDASTSCCGRALALDHKFANNVNRQHAAAARILGLRHSMMAGC